MDAVARASRGSSFNVLLISTRSYFLQAHLKPPYSHHTIFTFLVPALLELLQLKYQGKPNSPFETHPMTMRVALASLILYCLVLDAKQRFFSTTHPKNVYAHVINRCIMLSRWLSVVSLGSIHFPDPLVGVSLVFCIHSVFSKQVGMEPISSVVELGSSENDEHCVARNVSDGKALQKSLDRKVVVHDSCIRQ